MDAKNLLTLLKEKLRLACGQIGVAMSGDKTDGVAAVGAA
jgi:uncharacterized protein YunC (DUF1805 family)